MTYSKEEQQEAITHLYNRLLTNATDDQMKSIIILLHQAEEADIEESKELLENLHVKDAIRNPL